MYKLTPSLTPVVIVKVFKKNSPALGYCEFLNNIFFKIVAGEHPPSVIFNRKGTEKGQDTVKMSFTFMISYLWGQKIK